MKKSYWIYNQGDYEIYHANLVNSRRQEFGVDYPVVWKVYGVEHKVDFHADVYAEEDTTFILHLEGKGYVFVDLWEKEFADGAMADVSEQEAPPDRRYRPGVSVSLSKGEHHLHICCLNLTGLPAAYIEGEHIASDGSFYTLGPCGEHIPVGYSTMHDSPEKIPSRFLFSYERKLPVSAEKKNGGTLFDFGKEIFGYLYVKSVSENEKIHVSYGESLEEALDVRHSIVWEDVEGKTEYKLTQRAFRYIFITGTENPTVEADYEYLPLPYRGAFRCDDEAVNRIYDTCAYTLHINTREVLTEAIKRDRWLWGGDSYQAFKFNTYLFHDKDIVRRSLIGMRGKDPFTEHINTIADYSLYFILGCLEYYETYGDTEFIRFIYDRAKTLMDFCASREDAEGFFTKKYDDWIFVDWADIDKDGPVCAEQILYIASLRAMAKMAALIGRESKEYEKKAQKLTLLTNERFWCEKKGAYISSFTSGREQVTRHANIFAILYGIADKEQTAAIIKNVLENDQVPAITTPFFGGFELDAMAKIGRTDLVEKRIRTYWKGMLDLGATTVWEEYNPEFSGAKHYEMYNHKYGKSLCHAWGASPIYLLGRYFLGVYPTGVAYETFEVRPNLGGFSFFEGTVPVGDGEVRIYLSKEKLSVTATKDGGTLCFGGKTIPLPKNETIELKM